MASLPPVGTQRTENNVVARLSANSDVPYRATLAEALAEFAVGFYFKTDDKAGVGPYPGVLWIYQRTAVSPFYEAKIEGVSGDIDLSGIAPLNSPALTGTPTAPTPALANTTQIATAALVKTTRDQLQAAIDALEPGGGSGKTVYASATIDPTVLTVTEQTLAFFNLVKAAQLAGDTVVMDVPITTNANLDFDATLGPIYVRGEGAGSFRATGTGNFAPDGSASINGGFSVINTPVSIGPFTATGTAFWPTAASNPYKVSTVECANAASLSAYDIVFLYGPTNNATSTTTARDAEQLRVLGVSGTTVYLDGRLENVFTTGTLYKVPETDVVISGKFSGDHQPGQTGPAIRRSVLWFEGITRLRLPNIEINGNSSRGIVLASCFEPLLGNIYGEELDNRTGEQRYGYLVIPVGATRRLVILNLHGRDMRHLYTDGSFSSTPVLRSGNVVGTVIANFEAVSCTAAAIDTHPDSIHFYAVGTVHDAHTDALQPDKGLLYAVQMRCGGNVFVRVVTNLEKGIQHSPLRRYDHNAVFEIDHQWSIVGVASSTNKPITYNYNEDIDSILDNPAAFPRTGAVKTVVRSIGAAAATFTAQSPHPDLTLEGTWDWSPTNSGWPASTGPNAQGESTGGFVRLRNATILDPVTMQIGNTMEWVLENTQIYVDTAKQFSLANGAKLTAVSSSIIARADLAADGTHPLRRHKGAPLTLSNGGAFCVTAIADPTHTAEFRYANLAIDSANATTKPFADNSTAGTVTVKDLGLKLIPTGGVATRGDGNFTLVVGTDARVQRFITTLTTDRTVTLSTTGAQDGDTFTCIRVGAGSFLFDIGGLKKLKQYEWCTVRYRNGTWELGESGFTNRTLLQTTADASITVHPAISAPSQLFGTTLTADRTVTLPAVGLASLQSGDEFLISRGLTAAGAFDLLVTISGGATIATLGIGKWVTVKYNGSNWIVTAGGDVPKAVPLPDIEFQGNANVTLIVGQNAVTQHFATTLTADRTITLSTSNATPGKRWRINRPAGGAFNLFVGTAGAVGTLTAADQWMDVVVNNSSAWERERSGIR